MTNLVTYLVISGAFCFFVFWLALAINNRRKGRKTPFLQLLVPLVLIGVVFVGGYLLTGNTTSTDRESFGSSQNGLVVVQGGISLLLLALGTVLMIVSRRRL